MGASRVGPNGLKEGGREGGREGEREREREAMQCWKWRLAPPPRDASRCVIQ